MRHVPRRRIRGPPESDKLRTLTEEPELRALAEPYLVAPPGAREPALRAFIEKADVLYPDWRETWETKERDGTVLRALAIHCVLRIRERSDLDELEWLEAKNAEADFVTSFDEVAASPNPSAAFRMALAFWELMRIAKLDPEEMEEIKRQTQSAWSHNGGMKGAKTRREKRDDWQTTATELERVISEEDPNLSPGQVATKMLQQWPGREPPRGYDTFRKFVRGLRAQRS
jgi:hypothetical protein